ncbi:MAG: redoxin domain-containing protein [Pseudomonadales bacterium]
MIRTLTSVAVLALMLPSVAGALQPKDRVENFRLLDHTGKSHELYYYDDAAAVVIMAQSNHCQAVQASLPRLRALQKHFAERDVAFFMLNSDLDSDRAEIAGQTVAAGTGIPVLMDSAQLIGESLNLSQAGEVYVLNPKNWQVEYRGALDAIAQGQAKKKQRKQEHVKLALDSMLAGEQVAHAVTEVAGCDLAFPQRQAQATYANISYATDIAPILLNNCVSCHREGGIGPWAMSNYTMIRGFAPMIREVLRTQRMPPWHADPAYGHFSNDRSLSTQQIQTLVHWIEAGAPRGEGEDALAVASIQYTQWDAERSLGKPHFVVDIPAAEIPATGVVDYKYHYVENPIGRDVWVQAAEILPGDRAVLHHVITAFGDIITEGQYKGRMKHTGGLRGYAPGITNQAFPENTGVFLPANATLEFQVHYTTNGKATVDESKMGLWFYDEPPEQQVFSKFIANGQIRIPPNTKSHAETEEYVLPKDAVVYNLLPHAHFRGKAAEFRAFYPDGSEEVLLSVPNYDFNWQTTYEFEEPKFMPAGTKIVQTNWWDNSAQNPANPDPNIEVTWGEQSWEEMLFGAFLMRLLDEEEASQYRAVGGGGVKAKIAGAR